MNGRAPVTLTALEGEGCRNEAMELRIGDEAKHLRRQAPVRPSAERQRAHEAACRRSVRAREGAIVGMTVQKTTTRAVEVTRGAAERP